MLWAPRQTYNDVLQWHITCETQTRGRAQLEGGNGGLEMRKFGNPCTFFWDTANDLPTYL